MAKFGCLICKVKFREHGLTERDHNGNEMQRKFPVLTVCGHYFHLDCLQASFVYEYEKFKTKSDQVASFIKMCPLQTCKTVLAKTQVTRIKVQEDDGAESAEGTISQLKEEIKDLKEKLIRSQTKSFMRGDVVSVDYTNGDDNDADELLCGTVSRLLIEIELPLTRPAHNTPKARSETPKAITSSANISERGLRGHGLFRFRKSDHLTKLVTVPIESVRLAEPIMDQAEHEDKSLKKLKNGQQSGISSEINKPKWAAGDRVYFTKEKEFATIKWIGSRQYKFMVAIEYDRPVGDDYFDSEDLPFLIKQGYGKQLMIDDLHATAEKVEATSPRAILNNIWRWSVGFERNRRPHNPMFYVDRPKSSGS